MYISFDEHLKGSLSDKINKIITTSLKGDKPAKVSCEVIRAGAGPDSTSEVTIKITSKSHIEDYADKLIQVED